MNNKLMDLRNALAIVEQMIDRLQRELYSNGSMLGAVSSAYQSLSPTEKKNYDLKRKQLTNLLAYRTELLNSALEEFSTSDIVDNPLVIAVDSEDVENKFNFSI